MRGSIGSFGEPYHMRPAPDLQSPTRRKGTPSMRHARIAPLIALAISAGTACNDNEITGPTAPPPEVDDRTFPTTATTLPDTSPSTETTGAASSGPTTTAEPALPTVSTIIPQNSTPLDPNDPNNRRPQPATPEEVAIITAYLEGLDIATAVLVAPANPDDPRLDSAPLTEDLIARTRQGIADDLAADRALDVSGGVRLRPFIVSYSPGETAAIVFDCQLDATVWRSISTGEVTEPPTPGFPNSGPDVATAIGVSAQLILSNGKWLLESVSSLEGAGACL
jgi:hypothetical protein